VKKIIPILLITLAFLINYCSAAVKISVLDVGQGDATLIQTSEQNILIDTSDVDERLKLERELYRLGAYRIDKLILTHPHADHIGNAAYLIKSGVIKVKSVYDNGVISGSKLYLNYVTECIRRNVNRDVLNAGAVLDFGEGCRFIVYSPHGKEVELLNNGDVESDANNESIVGRLEYGNFSMLFTGDAEQPAEEKIMEQLQPVNVLKAGHHGSKTSSGAKFLQTIKPECVIISAGEPTQKRGGNTYGHPHPQSLERFAMAGVNKDKIYWTWKNGTITIESDGEKYTVTPQTPVSWYDKYLIERIGYTVNVTKL